MAEAKPELYCNECGQPIDPDRAVWLEMDRDRARYYKIGTVPDNRSQGCFEFGPDCARKVSKGAWSR